MAPAHTFRMDPTQRELADKLAKMGFGVKEMKRTNRRTKEEMVIGFEVVAGTLPTDPALKAAFELWGAAKNVPAWKVRAAECMHGWGIGKEVTSAEFDKAIAAAETAGTPKPPEIVEKVAPATEDAAAE